MKLKQISLSKISSGRRLIVLGVAAVLLLGAAGAAGWTIARVNTPQYAEHPEAVPESELPPAAAETKSLAYLIEEEKLAHDVYVKMDELWGARVFANISSSETSHQMAALSVLQAQGIADPRLTEPGTFRDPDLQKLYDQLVAKGSQSVHDAYEVGRTIELTDIADLKAMIAATDNDSEKNMLQVLLKGSQNHLAAFNRQLGL